MCRCTHSNCLIFFTNEKKRAETFQTQMIKELDNLNSLINNTCQLKRKQGIGEKDWKSLWDFATTNTLKCRNRTSHCFFRWMPAICTLLLPLPHHGGCNFPLLKWNRNFPIRWPAFIVQTLRSLTNGPSAIGRCNCIQFLAISFNYIKHCANAMN